MTKIWHVINDVFVNCITVCLSLMNILFDILLRWIYMNINHSTNTWNIKVCDISINLYVCNCKSKLSIAKIYHYIIWRCASWDVEDIICTIDPAFIRIFYCSSYDFLFCGIASSTNTCTTTKNNWWEIVGYKLALNIMSHALLPN